MIAYFPMKNSSTLCTKGFCVCGCVCSFVFVVVFFSCFFSSFSQLFMPLLRHEMTCFALVWTVKDEVSTFFFYFFLKRESADSNLIPG